MKSDTTARWMTGAAIVSMIAGFFVVLGLAIRPAPPMIKTTLDLGCQSSGL